MSEEKNLDHLSNATIRTLSIDATEAMESIGSLEDDLPGAYQAIARLEALSISMGTVTAELEDEGVKSFASAWKALMDAMEVKRQAVVGED